MYNAYKFNPMKHLIDRFNNLLKRMQDAGMTSVSGQPALLFMTLIKAIKCIEAAVECDCDHHMIEYMEKETSDMLDKMEIVVDKEITIFTEKRLTLVN